MTMLWCDSGAYFSYAQRLRKWDAEGENVTGPATTFGAFASDSYGYQCAVDSTYGSGGVGTYLQKNFPSNLATSFISAWFRLYLLTTVSGQPNWMPLIVWRDNGTTQCQVVAYADGSVGVVIGTGTEVARSAPNVLSFSEHRFVSAKGTIGNSGEVTVRVDSVEVVSYTGDTSQSANAYATNCWFGGRMPAIHGNVGIWFSDPRINDTSGANNTGFQAASRVLARVIVDDGHVTNHAVTGAVGPYQAVDDDESDDDTSYIASSTPGDISRFEVEGVAAVAASITAIAVNSVDKRTDATPIAARHSIRYGGGPTTTNGVDYAPGVSYMNHQTIFEGAFSLADLNTPLQIGVELRP